ncbi:hypothetical protein K6Q96_22405 [Grimontia kaedaensis]|uniref:Uncharacterized protein n=1 Tax=Grimontia kaedaensis TaxID=2872157 RepID=A0ABY4WZT5_9GAMM|nr:hypothetical protein [Grimontia kaedaensis]USH04481.1 hypothetical protein K6Q96_22405 [Grimontia kaedaensis]
MKIQDKAAELTPELVLPEELFNEFKMAMNGVQQVLPTLQTGNDAALIDIDIDIDININFSTTQSNESRGVIPISQLPDVFNNSLKVLENDPDKEWDATLTTQALEKLSEYGTLKIRRM